MKYLMLLITLPSTILIGMENPTNSLWVEVPQELSGHCTDILNQLSQIQPERLDKRSESIKDIWNKMRYDKNLAPFEKQLLQKKIESSLALHDKDLQYFISLLDALEQYTANTSSIYEYLNKENPQVALLNNIIANLRRLRASHDLEIITTKLSPETLPTLGRSPSASIAEESPSDFELKPKKFEEEEKEKAPFVLPTERPVEVGLGNTLTLGIELEVYREQIKRLRELYKEISDPNSEEGKKIKQELQELESHFKNLETERQEVLEEKTDTRFEIDKHYNREKAKIQEEINALEKSAENSELLQEKYQQLNQIQEEQKKNMQNLSRARGVQTNVLKSKLEEQLSNSNGQLARPWKKPKNNTNQ